MTDQLPEPIRTTIEAGLSPEMKKIGPCMIIYRNQDGDFYKSSGLSTPVYSIYEKRSSYQRRIIRGVEIYPAPSFEVAKQWAKSAGYEATREERCERYRALYKPKARDYLVNLPHAVYRIKDRYGLDIYIGCTCKIVERITDHARRIWWHEAADIETECYPDRRTAREREKALIKQEDPKYNWMHAPSWDGHTPSSDLHGAVNP